MEPKKVEKLNKMTDRLFNEITEADILRVTPNGTFLVGSTVIPAEAKQEIVSQANIIQEMELWRMLVRDMKYQANKRMYTESKDIDDMIFGKAMLYSLDVLEQKLKNLSRMK
jgi:hypothetical protein